MYRYQKGALPLQIESIIVSLGWKFEYICALMGCDAIDVTTFVLNMFLHTGGVDVYSSKWGELLLFCVTDCTLRLFKV